MILEKFKTMTLQEKAVANLLEKGIEAFEDNSTVYVYVGDVPLEIAIYEQEYQAKEWDDREVDFAEWTASELFEFLIDNYIISDDEEFEGWKNDRSGMIDMCEEYQNK